MSGRAPEGEYSRLYSEVTVVDIDTLQKMSMAIQSILRSAALESAAQTLNEI